MHFRVIFRAGISADSVCSRPYYFRMIIVSETLRHYCWCNFTSCRFLISNDVNYRCFYCVIHACRACEFQNTVVVDQNDNDITIPNALYRLDADEMTSSRGRRVVPDQTKWACRDALSVSRRRITNFKQGRGHGWQWRLIITVRVRDKATCEWGTDYQKTNASVQIAS